MIIQNSTLNSSASRRYQSARSSYIEHKEWDNATGTTFTQACSKVIQTNICTGSYNGVDSDAPLFLNNNSEHGFCSDELPENHSEVVAAATESKAMNAESLMERFQSSGIRQIPTVQERIEMVRDIQSKALDYLIRILFGDNAEAVKGSDHIDRTTTAEENSANELLTQEAALLGQPLGKGGSHITFFYYAEKETTCFNTVGTAVTADGRELSFNLSVEMSRSFTEMASEQIDFGQPRLCDPLVINLGCNVASVSDQKFFFDLDADGTEDEISILGANSGYLALDNNADGIINDGSELFGTKSGNGFKDLLAYDEDGNGWIDEGDSIFQKLKIWSMDQEGNSTLVDLKEAGLGAIYLGYENTEFSLKNAENETNAVIQKTGIFLYENGDSGTIQQMDLAV